MSTTLTNGLKLPDKGSVDWYADMQSNYAILDGAVGTIAEHTSALAGKAPAVHTHTKSDVTDLFNSDNTWSGSNSFNSGLTINNAASLNTVLQNAVKGDVSTTGDFAIFIKDKVNGNAATSLLAVYRGGQDSGGSYAQINIDTKGNDNNRYNNSILLRINPADNSNNAVLIPQRDKTIDLGTSLNQWKSVYAQTYYYNGTEFQSKFVTADTVQTVNGVKTFTAYVGSIGSSTGDEYSGNTRTNLWLMGNRDTEGVSGILFDTYRQNTAQGTGLHILGIGIKENSVRYEGCRWGWYWDNNLNGYTFDFKPTTQGANQALKHNLGTSDDKWDTLNGVNPGALSLPDMDSTVSKTTELAAAIDKTQTANSWTADFTGILRITWFVKNLTGPFRCAVFNNADIRYATWGQTFSANDAWFFIISFPVQNGKTYYFDNSFTRTSEDTAPIVYGASAVYCLGNV